jgi:peptidoglycan/LPS O-acetylase OafA/YrhL
MIIAKSPSYLAGYSDTLEKRQNNYDFLRIFAALLVVLSHSFLIADNSLDHDLLMVVTHGQISLGRVGVFIFFVLSGFLITGSYQRSKCPASFLKNRFLRIMPGFLCVVLASVFILGPLFTTLPVTEYLTQSQTYQYLLNLTFLKWDDYLPGVFQHTHAKGYINGSLWTIRFEIYCYLVVCVLGMLNLLKRRTALILLVATGCINALFSTGWINLPAEKGFLYFIKTFSKLYGYFSIGMLFYLFRKYIVLDTKLIALALLLLVMPFCWKIPGWLLAFPAAYLLFSFAYSPRIRFYNAAKSGDLSYGIYIYAWPIQQIMDQYLGNDANWLTIFVFSLPVILGFAWLSWHFVEKRSLQLKVQHVQ